MLRVTKDIIKALKTTTSVLKSSDKRKIILSLLVWNTSQISINSLAAYIREATYLKRIGYDPCICICDNGSADGFREKVFKLSKIQNVQHHFIFNKTNVGNSIARNQIIKFALLQDADYLLMMDGDIEIVPFSSIAMINYLSQAKPEIGCIGANFSKSHYTKYVNEASRFFCYINSYNVKKTNWISLTQYGLYRTTIFKSGVKFEERYPFDCPGWGCEDNDLAFEMYIRGYINHFFNGMIYLHRSPHSSVSNMQIQNLDAQKIYNERRAFLIEKWRNVSLICNGPLKFI